MTATIANWNEIDREIAADEAYRAYTATRPGRGILPTTLAHVPNSTYTVVMDDTEADWETVRIKDWTSRGDGSRVVALLKGPDNGADYVGVGTVHPDGRVSLWSAYRDDARVANVVARLSASTSDDREAMRHGYALLSGKCARCGRKLTVPASLHRGLGPECAGVMNPAKRKTGRTRAAGAAAPDAAPVAPDTDPGDCPF